ncbi:Hypothetical predicted protein, partial [Xyrichtys novacula]
MRDYIEVCRDLRWTFFDRGFTGFSFTHRRRSHSACAHTRVCVSVRVHGFYQEKLAVNQRCLQKPIINAKIETCCNKNCKSRDAPTKKTCKKKNTPNEDMKTEVSHLLWMFIGHEACGDEGDSPNSFTVTGVKVNQLCLIDSVSPPDPLCMGRQSSTDTEEKPRTESSCPSTSGSGIGSRQTSIISTGLKKKTQRLPPESCRSHEASGFDNKLGAQPVQLRVSNNPRRTSQMMSFLAK